MPSYQKQIKRLKTLLLLKESEEKRMEDYIYNVVKVHIFRDSGSERPIGEGGTSLILAYRVALTYIGLGDSELPSTH